MADRAVSHHLGPNLCHRKFHVLERKVVAAVAKPQYYYRPTRPRPVHFCPPMDSRRHEHFTNSFSTIPE